MGKIRQKIKRVREGISKKRKAYLAMRPHRSFRKTPKQRKMVAMATIKQTATGSFKTIWQERRVLFWLAAIYIIASYIFVGGVAQADFVSLKDATVQVFGGSFNSVGTVFSLLTSTMSGAFNGNLSELQQFLAVLIAVLFWLTVIWALRMRFADKPIKARDALYNSGAPLVSYVLVALFIVVQIIPGAIGVAIFALAEGGGYIQTGVEIMAFAAAAFLLVCLSVYWLAGSLMALVVVTLPQMYPWRAMQIASELAIGRRVRLVGHTVGLALILLLVWVVTLVPTLLVDSWLRLDWLPLLPLMVQLLGAFTLAYFATYVYRLYRSML